MRAWLSLIESVLLADGLGRGCAMEGDQVRGGIVDTREAMGEACVGTECGEAGCFLVLENPDEPFDIKFQINERASERPSREQMELYNECERACSVIKSLDRTDEAIKRKYFVKLLSLSRAGLVGRASNPELAHDSLDRLKEEIVLIEGRRIKNGYMKRLGAYVLAGLAVFAVVWLMATYCAGCNEAAAFALLGIGAMLGAWVSFGARKFEIRFEELSAVEKDMMEPLVRLVFIYASTALMTLFIISGMIEIKVGSLDTANMASDPKAPLVVGAVCGLVESRIGVRVYHHANSVVGD